MDRHAGLARRAVAAEMRRSGAPAVSDTYVLLRDRALPPAQRQHSFVLATPGVHAAGQCHRVHPARRRAQVLSLPIVVRATVLRRDTMSGAVFVGFRRSPQSTRKYMLPS